MSAVPREEDAVGSLEARVERQRAELRRRGVDAGAIEVVVSPYRVCPIGAHSDHQGGPVLAVDCGSTL